ncbi:MAG TPA: hypothetical protein QGF02_00170 [Candidatus Babeliales bacterium]|nr:hypothetical protein [Candidatus Babeliales bacterium]
MKKIMLGILLLFSIHCMAMVEQMVPMDLDELFSDPVLRQQVEQQFTMPSELHTNLQRIMLNPENAQLLDLAHKYSREELPQSWGMIAKNSEFKPVSMGATLILEHDSIPGYLIEIPLVKDHKKGNINEYQNVSRIPNWLIARNALQEPISIQDGFDKEIALPEEMYFWDIRNITQPSEEEGHNLSDRNFIVVARKMDLIPSRERAPNWSNMSENKKLAIKYLILQGKMWDFNPNNINFTTDGRFAYLDTEQPNNSQREDFFAKNLLKEL